MKPSIPKSKPDKYPLQNPDKEPLTTEKLLTFPGCEHYSNHEASAVIESIKSLAGIFLELHRDKSICIDNQLVVDLNSEAEMPKVVPLHSKNKAA